MPAVTKADLITHLFEVLGINKREAKEVVDLFFDELSAALVAGDVIKLPELGMFSTQTKAARQGRNPKTGEKVTINPRRVVVFKATDSLKQKIQIYGKPIAETATKV